MMMANSLLLPKSSFYSQPKVSSFFTLPSTKNQQTMSIATAVSMHRYHFSLQAAKHASLSDLTSRQEANSMLLFLKERGFSDTELEKFMACSNETWKRKLESFENLGFSEDDVARMLRSSPQVFRQSEEKMQKVIEVLLQTGNYDLSTIVSYPICLSYSVEERYKPRLEVLNELARRNLLDKWPRISALSQMPDKRFFEKYVEPYIDILGDTVLAKNAVSYKVKSRTSSTKGARVNY